MIIPRSLSDLRRPQMEELDENNAQIEPPGFHLIPLPFADDIRAAPVQTSQRGAYIFEDPERPS